MGALALDEKEGIPGMEGWKVTELTPQQKQEATIRFAKAMGWALPPHGEGYPAFWMMTAPDWLPRPCLRRDSKSNVEHWDPWTSIADAVELADKLDIRFRRFWGGPYIADAKGRAGEAQPDLCTAICTTALAYLEKETEHDRGSLHPKLATPQG